MRIFSIIKNTLYYAVIAFLTFIIIFSVVKPGELINVIQVGWYRVVSQSMEPIIMVDDYIVAKKYNDDTTLNDGDIIIFETYFFHDGDYGKDVVTHHFAYLSEEGYVITYPHSQFDKEPEDRIHDNWAVSPTESYFVTKDDILGVHIETIPFHDGPLMISYMFQRPLGITFTLIIGSFIVYLGFIIYKGAKGKKGDISNDRLEDVSRD